MQFLSSSILILIVLHISSALQNETESCINNYEGLKTTLRDNTTDNIEKLLDTFYPPNESTVHSVLITYCFVTTNTSSNDCITYHWSSNALLLIIEPELLNALTLNLFDLISRNVTLLMQSPFCSTDVNTNLELTDTLTTWVKSYGKSNFETNQGYAIYYDTEKEVFVRNTYNINNLRISIVLWLVFVTFSMTLILNGRLCSKTISDKMEQTVENALDSAMTILTLVKGLKEIFIKSETKDTKGEIKNEDTNENEETQKESSLNETLKTVIDNGKKINLENLTNIDNILVYTVILVFFIIWDIVAYIKANKEGRIVDWYIFFPIPIIFPIHILLCVIITTCTGISVVVISRNNDTILKRYTLIKELYGVLVLTLLVLFVFFHGFWAILMTITYPDRLTSAALFIVPLFFPLKLAFKTLSEFVKLLWCKIRKLNKNKIKLYMEDGKNIILRDILSFVRKHFVQGLGYAFFVSFWTSLLAVLYFVSDFLLAITDIRKDPFKLFVFVILSIIAAYRLVKICTPTKKETNKKKEESSNEDNNLTSVREEPSSTPRRIPPPVPPNKPKTVHQRIPSLTNSQQYDQDNKETIYDTLSIESETNDNSSGGIDNTVYSLAGYDEDEIND